MISHDELLQSKHEDILRIAARYGAYNVRIFGSVARGEAESRKLLKIRAAHSLCL